MRRPHDSAARICAVGCDCQNAAGCAAGCRSRTLGVIGQQERAGPSVESELSKIIRRNLNVHEGSTRAVPPNGRAKELVSTGAREKALNDVRIRAAGTT